MQPILLKGHSRSITMIKHNREGDLLVTCAKDHVPSLWYSHNGERIGTFHGHTGAVWACDISYNSEFLLTAAADASVKLWDLQTGKELFSFTHTGSARSVNFSLGDKSFVSVADQFGDHPPTVFVYDLAQNGEKREELHYSCRLDDTVVVESSQPRLAITKHGHQGRVTGAYWTSLNDGIITTGEDGYVKLFNPETGALITEAKVHNGVITNLAFNKTKTLGITSSKDNTAKLIDLETFEVLKTYETDRPVNSASISPIKEHVVLGGGQEAMSVTITAGRAGKFEARFFHQVFEEEFARVKGHFGPINSITFHPDGKSYTSGAEDGYNSAGTRSVDFFQWQDKDADEKLFNGPFQAEQRIQREIRVNPRNVKAIYDLPEDIDVYIWQYEHLRQVVKELNILVALLDGACTKQSCTIMKATDDWVFLCAAHKQPKECCAFDYIVHTLDNANQLLTSSRIFPSRVSINRDATQYFQSVARRLYRIFSHTFFHHLDVFQHFEASTFLCHRFVYFSTQFNLIPKNLLIIPDMG
ncbi:hypothetical protein DYB32_004561 [Aphanomyces invadans]|uniref:Eukaryotic translation initiation factor 3 subunit I n=1 Tax=Aphanomyces invadans TaxID=157072 RepID=A0A3R6VXV4_9STRA|nr:hypothetical protein DYB32_004561 [Aphanomyces invadans]